MMKIFFRTDASLQIGTGHVMRCLTLADALEADGARCHFICREHPGNMIEQISQRGFAVSVLPPAGSEETISDSPAVVKQPGYATWLGADWKTDAAQTKASLGKSIVDWLIVDHYSLDARWEQALRPMCRKLMVIDDLADRQHDCDVLLDQNYYADLQTRYDGKVPAHCRLLLGPRYALLREEFRVFRALSKLRTGQVKRILVFWGGVDAGNYTGLTIDALSALAIKDLHMDVVIGVQHPHRFDIEMACEAHGYVCHVQTIRMAKLMSIADLAVGAGGSTTWERCCLGLPCVVGAVAQNQVQAARDLSTLGAVKYIGSEQEITVGRLKKEIEQACSQDWLVKVSQFCFGLVDAQGVLRIIQIMK